MAAFSRPKNVARLTPAAKLNPSKARGDLPIGPLPLQKAISNRARCSGHDDGGTLHYSCLGFPEC